MTTRELAHRAAHHHGVLALVIGAGAALVAAIAGRGLGLDVEIGFDTAAALLGAGLAVQMIVAVALLSLGVVDMVRRR